MMLQKGDVFPFGCKSSCFLRIICKLYAKIMQFIFCLNSWRRCSVLGGLAVGRGCKVRALRAAQSERRASGERAQKCRRTRRRVLGSSSSRRPRRRRRRGGGWGARPSGRGAVLPCSLAASLSALPPSPPCAPSRLVASRRPRVCPPSVLASPLPPLRRHRRGASSGYAAAALAPPPSL